MTEPTKRKTRSKATPAKVERKREDPLRFVDNEFRGDGWTVKFVESYPATSAGLTDYNFNYDDFRNGIIQSLGMIDTYEIAKAYVKSKEGG